MFARLTLTIGLLLFLVSLSLSATQTSTYSMSPQQFWHTPFGTDPRVPLAGDADGDGRADLISLWPTGDGVVDFARTSAIGKPIYGNVAMSGFGHDAIGAACGSFVRKPPCADLVGIFADGSVRIAWGMAPGTKVYTRNDLAGQIPPTLLPKAPLRTAVGDFDGDGIQDILLLGSDGAIVLLKGDHANHFFFTASRLRTSLPGTRQFAAGPIGEGKRSQCVWLDEKGSVFHALVTPSEMGTPVLLTQASPDNHLAVGRFRGQPAADILVGQRLFASGNAQNVTTLQGVPTLDVAKGDGPWIAADIDGNGKDDLVRFRRSTEPFVGQDTFVHFSYDASDKAKGYYCSADDGLPDAWKLGLIKPGGLDLAELGCQVGHRDIVVELETFEDVPSNWLHSETDHVIRYFAAMPIQNPDGKSGIAMHVIYRKPYPRSKQGEIMGHFDDYFPPVEHRGIVHSVFAQPGGPLVSKGNGDNSHYDGTWKVFLHEFGHQLDLRHDRWHPNLSPGFPSDTGCALYPSLMSYTYSYVLGDDGEAVGYSDGSRASFHIDARHLSERLPFPIEKVKFLAGGPYHFHIKPSEDGKSTLVDWNWNGVFGEEDVCADVNYSHGCDLGQRYGLGKTQTAPVLVAHGDPATQKILLLYGQATPTGMRLVMRHWLGVNRDKEGDRWSPESVLDASAMTGDPSAAAFGKNTTWVAYPTRLGVCMRSLTTDGRGQFAVGESSIIPGTAGAEPTLTKLGDRLALLLWKSPETPIAIRFLGANPRGPGLIATTGQYIEVSSQAPVGATEGAATPDGLTLWIARKETAPGDKLGRTEALRYILPPGRELKLADRSWLDGNYAGHRMTLLWEKMAGLPNGRLYHLGSGTSTDQFITMNTAYPNEGGGWLIRRYLEPDFQSVSAPGACFFQGNIVYAIRRHDGNKDNDDSLEVAFYGNGANATPMGDYNDFAHIRDFGLSHSIREVAQ